MALVHKFELLGKDQAPIDSVEIHDDLILYIIDTLKWIPSSNQAKKEPNKSFGINYYGITLFDEESSQKMIVFLHPRLICSLMHLKL